MSVVGRLRKLEEPVNALTDGRPWSTEAYPAADWIDGYVVKLGVNEWFEPSHDLPHFKDFASFIVTLRNALPLLADVVEAAERALDDLGVGGPIDSPEMEAEVRRAHGDELCNLALLLARLSEQLDQEENG